MSFIGSFLYFCTFVMVDIHPFYKSGFYQTLEYRSPEETLLILPQHDFFVYHFSCTELNK